MMGDDWIVVDGIMLFLRVYCRKEIWKIVKTCSLEGTMTTTPHSNH